MTLLLEVTWEGGWGGGWGNNPSRVASREKWANLKTVTPMPHISIAVITPTHLTHTVLQWKKPLDCEEGMEKSYKKGQSEKTLANNREGLSLSLTHTLSIVVLLTV